MINSKKVLSSSEWTDFSKLHVAGDIGLSWVYCFFELNNTENPSVAASLSGSIMNIGSTINPTNRIEGYIKNCIRIIENNSRNLIPCQVRVLYKGNNVSK